MAFDINTHVLEDANITNEFFSGAKFSFFENMAIRDNSFALAHGDFIKFNTSFDPVSVGLHAAVTVWSAGQRRKEHQEQVKWLKKIHQELVEINQTTKDILSVLQRFTNSYAEILDKGLTRNQLREHWNNLDYEVNEFSVDEKYKISKVKFNKLKSSFNFICDHEFETRNLLRIPEYAEFLNMLSAGKDQKLVNRLLEELDVRINRYQLKLADQMITANNEFLKILITDRQHEWPLLYRNWGGEKPQLIVKTNWGSDWKGEQKDLRKITVTYKAKLDNMASFGVKDINQHYYVKRTIKAFKNTIKNARKNYKIQIADMFNSFNNYSALRKMYTDVMETDYKQKLGGAKSRVK